MATKKDDIELLLDQEDDLELEIHSDAKKRKRKFCGEVELFASARADREEPLAGDFDDIPLKKSPITEIEEKRPAYDAERIRETKRAKKSSVVEEEEDGELSEEEQDRRTLLIQRIRQIMAAHGGRLRGDELKQILGGSEDMKGIDSAINDIVKTYSLKAMLGGTALGPNTDELDKTEETRSPKFEAYSGGGTGANIYASGTGEKDKEKEAPGGDTYTKAKVADMRPDKALKEMASYSDELEERDKKKDYRA